MTMRRYEALLLSVPEITGDEAKSIEREFTRLAQGAKGNVISFERWGKFKLAYPVKKNDYGVYFLARFEVPADSKVIDDLKSLFTVKLHEVIMRSSFSRLDQRKSLEYQRPKSLEEAPTSHDVGAFLKKNKMEGLLSSVESAAKKVEKLEDSEKEQEQAADQAEKPTDKPEQE